MNKFPNDTAIDYFTRTDTVHIATERPDGGEVVTPIWAVVVDGVPYIRSGYGAGSKWYLRAQPRAPGSLRTVSADRCGAAVTAGRPSPSRPVSAGCSRYRHVARRPRRAPAAATVWRP